MGGMGGGGAAGEKQETGSVDIPVEIYGVICIYNPPDRGKLGTGAASAEKSPEAAAPAMPAAAATPAAPAGGAVPAAAKPSNP